MNYLINVNIHGVVLDYFKHNQSHVLKIEIIINSINKYWTNNKK